MNYRLFINFVLYGFPFLINASQEASCNAKRLLHRLEEHLLLQRQAEKRALADHPILCMFQENIREGRDPASLSGEYISAFIAASARVTQYTAELDRALGQPDTSELEILLRSKSALSADSYGERKLLWMMMDPVMLGRLRAVDSMLVQSMLSDTFRCPAIAMFAAKLPGSR